MSFYHVPGSFYGLCSVMWLVSIEHWSGFPRCPGHSPGDLWCIIPWRPLGCWFPLERFSTALVSACLQQESDQQVLSQRWRLHLLVNTFCLAVFDPALQEDSQAEDVGRGLLSCSWTWGAAWLLLLIKSTTSQTAWLGSMASFLRGCLPCPQFVQG